MVSYFWIAIAAIIGYLTGSISFARVIARLKSPGTIVKMIRQQVPGSETMFESDAISATAVRMQFGTGYGCLTAILDMVKVAIPTFIFMHIFPDQPYFLIAAAFGVVGHDLPLYHGFNGGRGESPIFGGLLIIDWLGVVITNLVGWLLGMICGNILVLRWSGLVLMIPWLWFRTHNLWYLAYIVFVNIMYWYAMRREIRQYFQLRDAGEEPTQEDIAQLWGMGSRLGNMLDQYNLLVLFRRIKR
ncbi:hypothetical protein GF337_00620 [candidate division KSB1 bacterium]|nr:hypothetical protein [candidate division KSB1 bacterium]